jgi:hypothetical protein
MFSTYEINAVPSRFKKLGGLLWSRVDVDRPGPFFLSSWPSSIEEITPLPAAALLAEESDVFISIKRGGSRQMRLQYLSPRSDARGGWEIRDIQTIWLARSSIAARPHVLVCEDERGHRFVHLDDSHEVPSQFERQIWPSNATL